MNPKPSNFRLSRRSFVKQSSFIMGGIFASPLLIDFKWPLPLSGEHGVIFKAAVFGDSVMWGQGLRREDKFAERAIVEIGKILNKTPKMEINSAHSGAPMRADADARKRFYETNTYLFKTNNDRIRFLNDNNQSIAQKMYGEVPSTFPTIDYQVADISRTTAATVDLVIINGGPNDLDFREFLHPKKHRENFTNHYDNLLEEYCYKRVRSLVRQVREKFTQATIIYTGYFAPFYPDKSNGDVKKLLYHLRGSEGYEVWINENIGIEDADQLVLEAQHRALYGLTRSLYWTSKAITEAVSNNALQGPGIIYIHPQFKPENAAFEPRSFFHNEYKLSDIKDPAKEDRESGTFSVRQFTKMHQLRAGLIANVSPVSFRPVSQEMLQNIAGPASLMKALRDFNSSPGNGNFRKTLIKELEKDMSRIINARRGSFLHPNRDGAQRYFDEIIQRYKDRIHDVANQRDFGLFGNLNGNEQQKMTTILKRYGFNQFLNQPSVFPHLMRIDSIAVDIYTLEDTEKRMYDNIFLRLDNNHVWQLNFPYNFKIMAFNPTKSPEILARQFEPNQRNFFTIDGLGMHLSEISSFSLERKNATDGTTSFSGKGPLRIKKVVLHLNGIQVFEQQVAESLFRDKPISFPYPFRVS